jgi:cysteinyl-tRNA synthetase
MVSLIKRLMEKGYAYKGEDGSIYYDISKFKDYGNFQSLKIEELKPGARVKVDEYGKEEASDFALWKAWDEEDGDVFWETEIGKGRPGWHIECSTMAMKYLGETIDIHSGGVDLIFPHHENEIAQSEAATGKEFARYWLHSEHLLVEGRRMAKSLGNFYTLRDLIAKGYDPKAIRFLLMATHYRQQLNFTFDGLEAAKNAVDRLKILSTDFWRLMARDAGKK